MVAIATRLLHKTQLFEREPPKEHSCEFCKNPVNSFLEEVFLKEEFMDACTHRRTDARGTQEVPIHPSHVYGRIKILHTIFEKGQPRNIPV